LLLMVIVCSIRAYTFDDMRDYTVITESAPLIYFCVDATERYALCTIKDHGLHLWDMETRSLVKRFSGSKHGDYVIFSCFGGYNQSFIATGSEGLRTCTIHSLSLHARGSL
jgi:hypothetical protein